jgi:prolyl-tRNA editing enzyme YbaK/EbsC (Cys-tRNA(Pro) deacylase)
VLRHRRLGDAELLLDDGTDLTGRPLAVGEQVQDPPADRITEDVEGVHIRHDVSSSLYKSILRFGAAIFHRVSGSTARPPDTMVPMSDILEIGTLRAGPALARPDLLADPVVAALRAWPVPEVPVDAVRVAEIDPELADTAAFCAAYGIPLEASANCVIIAGRRGGDTRYAAALVLATTRADVNGVIRRRLDARKASFAPMEDAVAETGMEYGGITALGLPDAWPVLVDERVADTEIAVVGSGLRRSKLFVPGRVLTALPRATVVPDLAASAPAGTTSD